MIVLIVAGYVLRVVFAVIALVAGVGAFRRLRTSPSGLCLGFGFALLGLLSLLGPIQHVVATFVSMQESDLGELARTQNHFSSCSHVVGALLWCVVAAGLALLPKSLERMREQSQGRPAQF